MNFDIRVTGMEDLTRSLEELTAKYPDRAGDLLRKEGRTLRKMVVQSARGLTNSDGSSKRSLGKVGSYQVSQPQGLGGDQFIEISAKSPHFHLVEHGHNLVTHSGQTIGYVQGRHFFEKAVKDYEGKMPAAVERMVNTLLAEGGLI